MTNGKLIRLLVDDEPFDVRYGQLRRARSRARLSRRHADADRRVVLARAAHACASRRRGCVSFTHRAIVGIVYEVEPLDGRVNVVVQSELVANEAIPHVRGRSAQRRRRPSRRSCPRSTPARDTAALLIHRTRRSGLRIAAAMDHVIERHARAAASSPRPWPDSARVVAIDVLEPGQRLRIVKLVAYGWSQRADAAGAARSGRGRAAGRAHRRLGAARSPSSAPTSTTSGRPATSSSKATPSCSRRCASRCFSCSRPARAPRDGRFRPRG